MSTKLGVDKKTKVFQVVTHGATEAGTKFYRVFISKKDSHFIKLDSVWK